MRELRIRRSGGALELEVRVAPRASRDAVLGVHDGALKVALTAPPLEGKANAALTRLLAKALGLPRRAVAVVRGEKGRTKTVRLEGVEARALPWGRGPEPGPAPGARGARSASRAPRGSRSRGGPSRGRAR